MLISLIQSTLCCILEHAYVVVAYDLIPPGNIMAVHYNISFHYHLLSYVAPSPTDTEIELSRAQRFLSDCKKKKRIKIRDDMFPKLV